MTFQGISRSAFRYLAQLLSKKQLYLTKSLSYRITPQVLPANYDYVRYATLGLCFEEIIARGVKGNVAELGVYKGDFSVRLNTLFSDRTLYLFDTFEGFHGNDVRIEQQKGFSSGEQDFASTSVDYVKSRLPFANRCVFRKGHFPSTATGLEDRFCFVNIDADLYEPIYQGLSYFYPRLEHGGYIFVHDFNNEHYSGARKAVTVFCSENNISYTPMPDSGGTAVITC